MEQLSMGMLVCDAFEASAPHESDRWATTDRGWLYDPAHPDQWPGQNLPVGNYLDYGPLGEHHRQNPAGAVHAVFTPWYEDHGHRRAPTIATHVHTPAQAQEWITEQYRLWTTQRAMVAK